MLNGTVAAATMKICSIGVVVVDVVKLFDNMAPVFASHRAAGQTALGQSYCVEVEVVSDGTSTAPSLWKAMNCFTTSSSA